MNEALQLAVFLLIGIICASATSDPCYPNPCGVNTQCFTSAGRPVCSCLPGYHGNPLTSCQRGECAGKSLTFKLNDVRIGKMEFFKANTLEVFYNCV